MTAELVAAALLVASPGTEEPDVLARLRNAILGGGHLPWVLLATGRVERAGQEDERFALEWEACQRLEVRGYRSRGSDQLLAHASDVLCHEAVLANGHVEKNGAPVRYVWEREDALDRDRLTIDIDPETGILARVGSASSRIFPHLPRRWHTRSVTAELSDFKLVDGRRLPHRLRLDGNFGVEDWTIERIEIVPLP